MDSLADIEDGKWLTLAELAEARGIDKLSAARLVRRHRWRRQKDNEGRVRALVPLKWIEGKEDSPRDNPADSPGDLSHALKVLETSIASLTAARDQAEARADRAEAARDSLQNRLEAAQIEVKQAQQEAGQLRIELGQAQGQVEQLRQAEAVRRGQGRWARLRAAWRGEK